MFNTHWLKALVILGVAVTSGCALLGYHSDGTVAEIAEASHSGEVFFQLDPPIKNRCGDKFPYVIDTATPDGQSLLGILLTAYAQKSPVRIESEGKCSESGSEWATRILAGE